MGTGDEVLRRKIGLEQEFFLVEESGEISGRADEFLERCREETETRGDGSACMAPEFVTGLVEVNTSPAGSLAELEDEYAGNLRLALRSARDLGLRLYPLGTYPLPLEPAVREAPEYQLQIRTVGPERFMDAGRCAGTHLHVELPENTVSLKSGVAPDVSDEACKELLDLYNLATALDPALITLTRSCPFYEGRATGLASRTAHYRGSGEFGWDGVYRDLPAVGALQPYAESCEHLVRQQFERYRAWLAAMDQAGVELGLFVGSGGDLLKPAWNPVRLNRQGTLELRGMDSNLPGTTLSAVALVLAAAERVRRENLSVTPTEDISAFEVADNRLLVPDFAGLGGLLYTAVAGETDDPATTSYVDSILDFVGTGPDDDRLEDLRRHRHRHGSYPTTEADLLRSYPTEGGRLSEEEGLRLVLAACDALEDQVSRLGRTPEVEVAETS